MKKSENKMIDGGDAENKIPAGLICNRECFTPGFGIWQRGDKVTDPIMIQKLMASPYFDQIKEDK